jgi:hypothetical protein
MHELIRRGWRDLAAVPLGLLLAGCGVIAPTPSPSPSPAPTVAPTPVVSAGPSAGASRDPDSLYAAIEGQVIRIRDLERRSPVARKIVDSAAMKAHVEDEFNRENPADRIAADERLAKTLGLIPVSSSLADLYREFLTSQVVGLYSPDDRELLVLDAGGGLGPLAQMIFAHEFTHALQDQHFNLKAYTENEDRTQGDRNLARLSLVEGDATAVMNTWAPQNLTMTELLQASQQAADPQSLAIIASMPPILRETALFPYSAGATFVVALHASGGWEAVDRVYADPPASSEQILHPAKYTARETPVAVAVPEGLADRMGAGWSIGTQDTLGEFQLEVWLRGSGGAVSPVAAAAAAGWGGDRVVLLDGPANARGVALLTAWDTTADATEFADAARAAISSFGLNGEVVFQSGSTTVRVLVGSDDATTGKLHQLLGAAGV